MTGALQLARAYSAEVVEPLLERELPGLAFATARLGSGSDVLGLDDDTSRDHDWGLRLTVLVADEQVDLVDAALERGLPGAYRGHPTRFATTWEPRVRQRAEVASPLGFARSRTGLDLAAPPDAVGWCSLTGQAVLEVVAGPVFRDDTGELTALRERLGWYPDDVWRYAIAADWARLAEELPFVGRAGERADGAGSRLIAARLARTAMHLGFLLARAWPPYSKWFGSRFRALPGIGAVAAALDRALRADAWPAREAGLVLAVEELADRQAGLGLPSLRPATEPFFDRPYRTVRGIAELVRASIADPVLRVQPPIGTAEQWSDDVTLLVDGERRVAVTRALFGG